MRANVNCDALVGYAWCRSSYAAIRSLSKLGLKVAAADISRLGMGQWSKYTSAFYLHADPQKAPEQFIEDIATILKQCNACFYLPGHDEGEVVAMYRNRLPKHVVVPLAEYEALSLANDKLRMTQFASSIGVPTPRYVQIKHINEMSDAIAEIGGRGVIKLLRGCSAKGVFYPVNAQDAETVTRKLVEKYKITPERYPMIQEFVEGEGWGVSCLYWEGKRTASFTHRRLREKILTGGTSTLRDSAHNAVIEDYAHKLLNRLNWHGLAMVEFKWKPQCNKAYFLEINPRLWGSIALPIACGVDFPALTYICATQGPEAAIRMCRDYPQGVVTRWYLGDVILGFNLLAEGRFREAIRAFLPGGKCSYDDLIFDDIKATIGEFVSYFVRFIRSGSTNPSDRGVLG
jgi:predicted ATP-grasp superfamily ATP-dependent carboligase